MTARKPFLEVLHLALVEDHRFPILEIFGFVFTVGTFTTIFVGGLSVPPTRMEESFIFHLVFSFTGLPVFVFVIILMKNIAYGLGNDLEKGVLQTYLSYPLKRRSFLTAKLLSSIGVPLLVFLGIQFSALLVLIPEMVFVHIDKILLSYAAILGYPLMIVSLVLLFTLFLRKGSISFVVGTILYFASGIFSGMLVFMTQSQLLLEVYTIIDPTLALRRHYPGFGTPGMEDVWTLSFMDAIQHMGLSYVLVILIFIAGYLYVERRLET